MGRKSKTNHETGERQCSKCKQVLPVSEFYRSSKRGYQGRCKSCSKAGVLEWQKRCPEKANAKNRDWKKKHHGEVLNNGAIYREKNREHIREQGTAYMRKRRAAMPPEELSALYRKHDLSRKYGITPEKYEEIFESQGRCCAICGVRKFGTRKPPVDHDHETGKVRGILCQHCNTALHKLETIRGWIEKAAAYLKRGEN